MSCERFREAIAGHAAGADLSPAAAAHLGSCAACTTRLETQRRRLADVDAELTGALSLSASPEFVARVTSSVNATRPRSIAWRPAAAWVGLAAAAAIVAASFLRGPEPPAATTAPMESASTRPAPSTPSTPDGNRALAPADRPAAVRRPRSAPSRDVAAPPAEDPPVIVDADQARAIARLRELLNAGRITEEALPPARPHEASDLTIAPLQIPDITVPDVESIRQIPAPSREQQ